MERCRVISSVSFISIRKGLQGKRGIAGGGGKRGPKVSLKSQENEEN